MKGDLLRILISGGAGFVGSTLAKSLKDRMNAEVTVLDNLRRRGSEFNLKALQKHEIHFRHGDVRNLNDLLDLDGNFDLMIEASAEPSVHAGQNGSPAYVIDTNLHGTINCLEFARNRIGLFLYLSTSRVYSIESLRKISLSESSSRFKIAAEQDVFGISEQGINENFPTNRARSFYGTTKLASEFLIQEYVHSYGLKALINRCGIIAGPGQFGTIEQGVISLWVACHHFGIPLKYSGFGGTGKQVRDLLHPHDLVELLCRQLDTPAFWEGNSFNIGGGRQISVSLLELTELCRSIIGKSVPIEKVEETDRVDVPLYLTDYSRAYQTFGWSPKTSCDTIIREIFEWISWNEKELKSLLFALNN